jgi:hypothetical protein
MVASLEDPTFFYWLDCSASLWPAACCPLQLLGRVPPGHPGPPPPPAPVAMYHSQWEHVGQGLAQSSKLLFQGAEHHWLNLAGLACLLTPATCCCCAGPAQPQRLLLLLPLLHGA